jgi:hypothetical protein
VSDPSHRHAEHVRRSSTRVAYFAAELPGELADALWQRPGTLVAGGNLLRSSIARRTAHVEWPPASYVLKHYVEPSRRHAMKRVVMQSRAWLTWEVAHRLADAGVATPRPVACVENRWGPLRRDSYLMYPYIKGITLQTCLLDKGLNLGDELVGSLWDQLSELWEKLRQLRVALSDTHLGNFIVSADHKLWVIDLDKTRFHRLAYSAARLQKQRWQQILRSAGKCSPNVARHRVS